MPKLHHSFPILFVLLMAVNLFVFRSIAFNISTHLLDWNDYPYYVWTIVQQAEHFRNFDFLSLGNANIYYPHQHVLFFSDLLLPQSLVASILLNFTQQYILIFNLLFFLTIAVNIISSLYFWKNFTRDSLPLFFLCLVTVLSPFVFLQLGHFQMLNFWPFLFGLSLLLNHSKSLFWKKSIIVGLLMALQFITSVYLAVFFIWVVMMWFFSQALAQWSRKKNIKELIQQFIVVIGAFLIFVFPFLWQYLQVQREYQIERTYGEYVLYAAHITDYIFQPYRSVFATRIFQGWNKFNQHVVGELAGWPGFSLIILAGIGITQMKFIQKKLQISFNISRTNLFFFLLLGSGFLFSLGPRLNTNGVYSNIPLPYHFVMKVLPLVEPVRATSRWSFILYFSLAYFALQGIQKIKKNSLKKVVTLTAICMYILEIIPLSLTADAKAYFQADDYSVITSECTDHSVVLLEYPVNRMIMKQDISEYLTYKTQTMLTSLHHRCNLINGYSGFVPREIELYETQLIDAFDQRDVKKTQQLFEHKDLTFVKVNLHALEASDSAKVLSTMSQNPEFFISASDEGSVVYQKKL